MALSNRERVGKALEIMTRGLCRFVEREFAAAYGERGHSTRAGLG